MRIFKDKVFVSILLMMLLVGCVGDWERPKRENKTETNILEMKLGQKIRQNTCYITKVPGGWLYEEIGADRPVFVPDNRESK